MTVAVPPAAWIFSRADFENTCASTLILRVRTPPPRTFRPVAQFLHDAALEQAVRRERVAFQLLQLPQVDDGEFLLEDVGEAAFRAAGGEAASGRPQSRASGRSRCRRAGPYARGWRSCRDPNPCRVQCACANVFARPAVSIHSDSCSSPIPPPVEDAALLSPYREKRAYPAARPPGSVLRRPRPLTTLLCFSGVQMGLRTSLI